MPFCAKSTFVELDDIAGRKAQSQTASGLVPQLGSVGQRSSKRKLDEPALVRPVEPVGVMPPTDDRLLLLDRALHRRDHGTDRAGQGNGYIKPSALMRSSS